MPTIQLNVHYNASYGILSRRLPHCEATDPTRSLFTLDECPLYRGMPTIWRNAHYNASYGILSRQLPKGMPTKSLPQRNAHYMVECPPYGGMPTIMLVTAFYHARCPIVWPLRPLVRPGPCNCYELYRGLCIDTIYETKPIQRQICVHFGREATFLRLFNH